MAAPDALFAGGLIAYLAGSGQVPLPPQGSVTATFAGVPPDTSTCTL